MKKYQFTALILGSSLAVAGSAFAGAGCDKPEGRAEHGGRGERFSQMDTNKDNKLSLAELTASRETWFSSVDTNKDGVATQAELEQSFASARQERMTKMFERQDVNKDGRISRDEGRMPSAWFEKADANKDGALTSAELSAARKNMGPGKHDVTGKNDVAGKNDGPGKPGGPRGNKLSRLDTNSDGKVELAEIRGAASQHFARLDVNSDGAVTSDEFRASHGHHGKHRRGTESAPTQPKTLQPKAVPAPTAS